MTNPDNKLRHKFHSIAGGPASDNEHHIVFLSLAAAVSISRMDNINILTDKSINRPFIVIIVYWSDVSSTTATHYKDPQCVNKKPFNNYCDRSAEGPSRATTILPESKILADETMRHCCPNGHQKWLEIVGEPPRRAYQGSFQFARRSFRRYHSDIFYRILIEIAEIVAFKLLSWIFINKWILIKGDD